MFCGLMGHFFLLLNNTPIVWLYQSMFIQLSIEEDLSCFQVLAVKSKGAVNFCVRIFVWT